MKNLIQAYLWKLAPCSLLLLYSHAKLKILASQILDKSKQEMFLSIA